MAVVYAANSHFRDLVLCLDAANPRSYNGTDPLWKDLSGNGFHAYGSDLTGGSSGEDANRFPVWQPEHGGTFSWSGIHALNIAGNMESHSQGTHELIFRRPTTGEGTYIADARNANGSWWLTNYGSRNINIHSALQVNDPPSYQISSSLWGRWLHLVIYSDSSGSGCVINGHPVTGSNLISSSPVNMNLGANYRIGNRFNGTGRWVGEMSLYRIYSRKLTLTEIQQNFLAVRERYRGEM